jgi:hypothetical protein
MPRPGFSLRPEGPRTPSEIANARAERAVEKPTGTPQWKDPNFLKEIDTLYEEGGPLATPLPKSRINKKPEVKLPSTKDLILLKARIEERRDMEERYHPSDAKDYNEAIEEAEALIQAINEQPDDLSLAEKVADLERRFGKG